MAVREEEIALLLDEAVGDYLALLRFGKKIGDPYSLRFDDSGYAEGYGRFNAAELIESLSSRITDEQLLEFFRENGDSIYSVVKFFGEHYTLRDKELKIGSSWDEIRERLERLYFDYGEDLMGLLRACLRVTVEMGRRYNNYLHIQELARGFGVKHFPRVLTALELAEVVERHKGDIKLRRELVPLVEEFLDRAGAEEVEEVRQEGKLTGDIFSPIMGYDDVKELLVEALRGNRRVHWLMIGPPATAKSLFLLCIERALEGQVYYATGSRVSGPGLTEALINRRPRVLLLDEVDKTPQDALSTLLSMMETGDVVETRYRKERRTKIETIVVAAANSDRNIPPELMSRFDYPLYFKPYRREEFINVCAGYLTRFEETPEQIARYAAERCWEANERDVRKVRGLVRMLREPTFEEVDRLIAFRAKYRKG